MLSFQNDDEEDEDEDGDDAEELLGKGARSAALLADRTRVSVALCVAAPVISVFSVLMLRITKCVNVFVLHQLLGKVSNGFSKISSAELIGKLPADGKGCHFE